MVDTVNEKKILGVVAGEEKQLPLPDLIDKVGMPRTEVVKVCQNSENIEMQLVVEDGLAYHLIKND